MTDAHAIATAEGRLEVGGAPDGFQPLIVAELARARAETVIHIARDDARAAAFCEGVTFFAPDLPLLRYPAWDCLPYDRVSPSPAIASARMASLAALAQGSGGPRILSTTVNAATQRAAPPDAVAGASFAAKLGDSLDMAALTRFLAINGFSRASAVREPGDYALRGGIVDIFPPGAGEPVRIDLFGDEIDGLRHFDPASQMTTTRMKEIALTPASETPLSDEAISRFRARYVAEFGPAQGDDPLYEAVSAGRRHQGMEHWTPLFQERMASLFDHGARAPVILDHLAEDAATARFAQIADYYEARARAHEMSSIASEPYRALPPDALYLDATEWAGVLAARPVRALSPFEAPEGAARIDAGGRAGRDFAPERAADKANVYDALIAHIAERSGAGGTVLLASYSAGARERMASVLADHGLNQGRDAEGWAEVAKGGPGFYRVVLELQNGFSRGRLTVVTEEDVLGDRLIRRARKSPRADNFLTEASALAAGDLVVHVEHGLGRYRGLKTLDVSGAPHDCLELHYAGGDRLYLPVENIELLSRYGAEEGAAQLDRLGGAGWQQRKARAKNRIREIAHELIATAAARTLRRAPSFAPPDGVFDEFCARFPYVETEDQDRAIAATLDDLAAGRPMDRLICGDVGFGKTEVALRAAFVAAMEGRQVAIIAPTTLLARQHHMTFTERFAGWPLRVAQLSRLVSAKQASATRAGLAEGQIDVVIGTHALLSKQVRFRDLGLLVIDEEQRFGVKHKERLKEMKADIHVLTLTATPIPRTLQLAMSGVRDLSLIATPPVDRLAVRTYVTPFDPVIVREALLREHYRGGQSFYVAPRIADLPEAEEFLKEFAPEVKVATAHGQMATGRLEDVMTAFYDGKYDVLLSTTIVESGLDIPTANTLIVHRADMFGLAQLYQLRGRIGRSKARGYAYLTTPAKTPLSQTAEKRLKVLQSLDSLGAGFTLASHDLDIRGAGNLLGDEQSGHIKEVGFELYQEMLEEAIASLRSGDVAVASEDQWSPQINTGAAVLIPEPYVADLDVRLGLYRRLGELDDEAAIDGFAAELIDRFGPLPQEVDQLLKVVAIKQACRAAGIAKLDAGPKGATLSFRDDRFANPAGLIDFITRQRGTAKLRPDHRMVYLRGWEDPKERLAGARHLARALADIAAAPAAAA